MKKLIQLFWGITCCMLIVACSSDENEVQETAGEGPEIKLSTSIVAQTRGVLMDEQAQMINSNQEVGVTITGASAVHNNVKWTSDGLGKLTNTGVTIKFSGNNMANIVAYQPYNSQWSDVANNAYTFAVQKDQSGSGFANSDLLWATASSNYKTPNVSLTFRHLLSKINVYISDMDGKELSGATINLTNVETMADFSNGNVTAKSGNKSTILAGNQTDRATAIVVPQSIAKGTALIKATLKNEDHEYHTTGDLLFESGKSYTFNMTINPNGELVLDNTNVDAWEENIIIDSTSSIGHNQEPYFSEAVEMMCLIFRLAGSNEYNRCNVNSVASSADSFFAPVSNHEAVQLAKQCAQTGVAYDAVTGYANMLLIDKQGNIKFDPNYEEGSNSSFDRWTQTQKYAMLKAVNDFYKVSNFHEWFMSWEDKQKQAITYFKGATNLDYTWFDSFYGPNDKLASRVILSFLIGPNNNGISFTRKDGTKFLTPTIGSFWEDNNGFPIFGGDMNLVVHEFSHPYCNPLIEKNWSSISQKAEEVFKSVKGEMQNQAYSSAWTMMCETLVRSCAIRYMMSHNQMNLVESTLEYEENNGFLFVRTLVNTLEKREQQASKYPTLESFMPEIIDAINNADIKICIPTGKYDEYTLSKDKVLLPGLFSIGPNKKVQFTRGNLYWDGSNWKLEDNQMNFPIEWDRYHVGHFFWSTTAESARSANYDYPANKMDDRMFCDGGDENHMLTVEGTSGLRALSGNADSELLYLFRNRPNAQKLFKFPVKLEGVGKAIVIAPDNYQGNIADEYTAETWAKAEADGLVCFAASGFRWDTYFQNQKEGAYFTSSPHDNSVEHCYSFGFSSNFYYCYPSYSSRSAGLAIRLVKDVVE